ncbi:hypothetical protein FA13DRAFT_1795171 [Coprinellus micaceus]|uniref:Uncharacterized protein n=1 Tax=Coprinellus micaceus TaxID=71717 RepID=A0A4Y7SYI2_COPMI|nr:hypothetical protein FA13DRAFT_1795171 [Coprinellus micaceus]
MSDSGESVASKSGKPRQQSTEPSRSSSRAPTNRGGSPRITTDSEADDFPDVQPPPKRSRLAVNVKFKDPFGGPRNRSGSTRRKRTTKAPLSAFLGSIEEEGSGSDTASEDAGRFVEQSKKEDKGKGRAPPPEDDGDRDWQEQEQRQSQGLDSSLETLLAMAMQAEKRVRAPSSNGSAGEGRDGDSIEDEREIEEAKGESGANGKGVSGIPLPFVSGLLRVFRDIDSKLSEGQRNLDRNHRLRLEEERSLREKRGERMVETLKAVLDERVPVGSQSPHLQGKRRGAHVSQSIDNANKNRLKRYMRAFIHFTLLQLHKVSIDPGEDEGGRGSKRRRMVPPNVEPDDEGEATLPDAEIARLLYKKFPPIGAEELQKYESRDSACVVITRENFRFDFTLPLSHSFNQDAIHVAARAFRDSLTEAEYGRHHPDGPLPVSLLALDRVEESVFRHFKYLQTKYKDLNVEQETRNSKRLKNIIGTRKTALVNGRVETIEDSPDLAVHRDLVLLAGRNSMSDEEIDYEEIEGHRTTVLAKVTPEWRSEEFGELYQFVDLRRTEMKKSGFGKRRTTNGKNLLRIRKPGRKTAAHPPPPGLWRNCFDKNWLSKRRPWELAALKIVDEDYDFERHERG